MGREFFDFFWRGKNPPVDDKPPLTTEKVKDLTEGIKSISELTKAVREVQEGIGGTKMEKPSEVIKEANELISEAEKFQERTRPQPKSPAEAFREMREAMEEARKLNELTNPGERERKKTRYTVLDDGNIVPDADGEMTLGEALVASRNLKQSSGPIYYVQNPETGEFVEAKGPMIIHQPTPPQVIQVTPEGEVRQVKPGEPIVIVKQQQSPAQQPSKSWIIKPDYSVEEYEPGGKPIVIAPSSQPINSDAVIAGIPIAGLPMEAIIELMKHSSAKEDAAAKQGMLREIIEILPEVLKRVDRQQDLMARQSPGRSPSEIEQAAGEMDIRKCQSCGTVFAITRGITEVLCPNPKCPLNVKEEK